ncbi:MAG: efflux RND transporter periplasmic adaptor subunit [Wolinella sp.]
MIFRNAFLAVSLIFFVGCGSGEDSKGTPKGGAMPPAQVDVISVQRGEYPISLEYPARVVSVQHVEVRAKVSGTILKKHYTEGTFVKEGTLLFSIDPAKFQASVNTAKAQLGVQEATFKQSEREWNRIKKLFSEKAVSEKERDDALAAYEMARASLQSAKANLENAKIDLGYTAITAPSSGVAGLKQKDVGAYVNANGVDTLMTTITQLDPIYVEFAIPDLERLKQNFALKNGVWKELGNGVLEARIISKDGESYSEIGKIDFADSTIDVATGSVKARATFANADSLLMPGQFVRIRIDGLVRNDSIKIPSEAIMQSGNGTFVYVIKDGKVAIKPIVIEQSGAKELIVSGALENGELLIVNNLMKIRPGASVQANRRD